MTKQEYASYLKTLHWRKFRALAVSRYRKCKVCKTDKNLNVHHLTYENLWCEQLADVTVLCRKCHEKTHNGTLTRREATKAGKLGKRLYRTGRKPRRILSAIELQRLEDMSVLRRLKARGVL